jgi:hypothetical protein
LVLNLSGDTGKDAVPGTAREKFVLDSDFALIEGHPLFSSTIAPTDASYTLRGEVGHPL